MAIPHHAERPACGAGELLRTWRQRRRLSQLELSSATGVSTRHLSFVETGRSNPSRALLTHLAGHLQIPLRERNRLLLAAGYAPAHAHRGVDEPVLAPLREALSDLLRAHEPNPALIVDRHWNLVEANTASGLLTAGADPALLTPPVNVLRLAFHPDGMARTCVLSPALGVGMLQRLRRVALDTADDEFLALLAECEGYLAGPTGDRAGRPPEPGDNGPLATLELATDLGPVRLFSVIATLAAPVEVTSGDLAIETFLPADRAGADRLRRLADDRHDSRGVDQSSSATRRP